MHTDEYEISLSRELGVCKSSIKKIKKFFAIMERKHGKTTAQFVEEYDSGKLTGNREDYGPGGTIMNRSRNGRICSGSMKNCSAR